MNNQKDIELIVPTGKFDELGFIPPPPPPKAQILKPKSSGKSDKGYTPPPPPPPSTVTQPSKPAATSNPKPKAK